MVRRVQNEEAPAGELPNRDLFLQIGASLTMGGIYNVAVYG
jgi:hypothetical protein